MGIHALRYLLIAAAAAVAAGVTFGPWCAVLRPVGDAYIMLLMVVVLPFVATGIIQGFAALSPGQVFRLLKPAAIIWLGLVALSLLMVNLSALLLPKAPNAILVEAAHSWQETASRLLSFLLPSNFALNMMQNSVPAIALFGVFFGIVSVFVEEKKAFVEVISQINKIILTWLRGLGRFSFVAVFCLVADIIGTTDFVSLRKIGLYLSLYAGSSLIFTFWILPYLVSGVLKMPYRRLLQIVSPGLVLVFVTNLSSLLLPLLVAHLTKAAEKRGERSVKAGNSAESIASFAYNFAQMGNFFLILFIIFASFYFRAPLSRFDVIELNMLSVPMSWGGPSSSYNAESFLADLFRMPKESFALFASTTYLTRNFQSLISGMSMYCFCLLLSHFWHARGKFAWRILLSRLVVVLLFCSSALWVLQALKPAFVYQDLYTNFFDNVRMQQLVPDMPSSVSVLDNSPPPRTSNTTLQEILASRTLRVGFNADTMPYCFKNARQEVVGYDMAFAYKLAADLRCRLELVPFTFYDLQKGLDERLFDIAMSGIVMSVDSLKSLSFSQAYAELENVLVVSAATGAPVSELEQLKGDASLKIGSVLAYTAVAKEIFPKAQIIEGAAPEEIFARGADMILWSLPEAKAWVYSHPQYQIVQYPKDLGRIFLAYATAQGDPDLLQFVNSWLALQKLSDFDDQQESFWIDGNPLPSDKKRWSIIQSLFHLD